MEANPLETNLRILLFTCLLTGLLSLLTGNVSWVDRLWSISPVVYVAVFAWSDLKTLLASRDRLLVLLHGRLLLMLLLCSIWGFRLTWNFARKGGYKPWEEDYRWSVIRKRLHPLLWILFDLAFIEIFLNFVVFVQTTPAYTVWHTAWTEPPVPLNRWDALAAVVTLAAIVGEAVADQQQWQFQTLKRKYLRKGKAPEGGKRSREGGSGSSLAGESDLDRGFLTSGLWAYSRHPNFFFEMTVWGGFYLFSVAASGGRRWVNGSLAGPVLLTALFQGSTAMTEELSAGRYPSYREYQRTTSRLIPWWRTDTSSKGK